MKWMRERDLLIAQTMAFVQSVTGKTPAADKPVATPGAFEPVDVRLPSNAPAPSFAAAPTSDFKPSLAEIAPVAELPRPVPMARIELRDDFQSEIRTRVANFRAHQEKFNREREAYCSATMAKVRAALGEHSESSRLGK
ncbi:hypothetical protein [Bradyrhizobium sp. AZCC 2289]|uniref:hypothetical protein n=1 Tax=Bradyrhizobium sp. AZCC 2289 TaxID=3117026 RepID=UPI002FF14927